MLEESSEMERLFSLIFIYSDSTDRVHMVLLLHALFTFAPIYDWELPTWLLFGHCCSLEKWGVKSFAQGHLDNSN